MNLNAYVNHQFTRGFLLKEEDLTKLLDFIKVRAREVDASENLRVKVYRLDSLVYEAPDLVALREEENAIRNRISRIQVVLNHESLKVDLDFDEEDNPSIKIESDDRDRAFLLYSELKEYLNTEVLVFRGAVKRSGRFLWMVLPMMTVFAVSFVILALLQSPEKISSVSMKELLAGDDLSAKLNYLISKESSKSGERSMILWLPVTMILAFLVEPCVRWTQNHWYPRNVFYFGKEKQRYEQLLARRSKWTWGVVVAFVVSVFASLAAWMLTKG